MKEVKFISCDVVATIEANCPHCDKEQIIHINLGPYKSLVNDEGKLEDETCKFCGELFTIDFY